MQESTSSKVIAKNTVAMYIRSIAIMVIGLYTSRIVLRTLGASDYGVYSVVGGFVTMMAFVNSVFVDSSQRYISYSIGEGNIEKLKKVFSNSLLTQFFLCVIILIIAETFGLWFVNHILVIDPNRMEAANVVYQCSIVSLFLSIMIVPFRACMVAHEKLNIYAYIGIVEVILMLLYVFLLLVIPGDKLIIYSLLQLLVSFLIPLWFIIYCKKHFEECTFSMRFDKNLFKEMFSFSGWVLVGNLGFTVKDQISNIIINVFLGTTVNAARGVAIQVNNAISGLVNNFILAMSPQITKQYAAQDYLQSKRLVYTGSKYAFYIMMLMIVPVFANIDYLLELWLGDVPEYTASFICIILTASMYYAMSKPLTTALQATGDIKVFQIGVAVIMLVELPIAYWVLANGFSPIWAVAPAIVTNIMGVLFRLYLLCKRSSYYNFIEYSIGIILRGSVLFIISLVISLYIKRILIDGLLGLFLSLCISFIITAVTILYVGIDSHDRCVLFKYVISFFRKK